MFLKPLLYLYAILPHKVRSYCWFRKKTVAYAKIELMWSAVDGPATANSTTNPKVKSVELLLDAGI